MVLELILIKVNIYESFDTIFKNFNIFLYITSKLWLDDVSDRHRQAGDYGLELAIVHAMVMAHKGRLIVHNRQASVQDSIQGLVVQIVLPTH